MKKIRLLFALLVPLFLVGCSKNSNVNITSEPNDNQIVETLSETIVEETSPEPEKADFSSLANLKDFGTADFHTESHKKYLDDPMIFEAFDDFGVTEAKSFLVGSDYAKLYPLELFDIQPDNFAFIKNYEEMDGEKIPFGTILTPVDGIKPIKNASNGEYYESMGYFFFEDNYNYFYKVSFNGKTGFIFGADLVTYSEYSYYTLSTDTSINQIYSELLTTDGKFEKFHSVEGTNPLTTDVANSLEENKLAIQLTNPLKYLSIDDLIDNYRQIEKYEPMFITTDLASHCQHLIFDRMLQYTEETYFAPRLLELCNHYIDAINRQTDVTDEVKALAIKYFQVPQLVLRTAPKAVTSDDWRHTVTYEEVENKESIIAEYPEDVITDYNNVMNASGKVTEIFGTEEMFNQYKPRGHYTKNPILEAYFRAEMWFGRIHFVIAKSDFNPETDIACKKMEPVAMFICDMVNKTPELYDEWAALFDPITTLIGQSDDLGFNDIIPLWNEQNVTNFKAWSTDEEKLKEFVKLCHERLRPPAISGNSIFMGPSEDEEKPPMGWRLLGQRFTYDSYIHQQVCAPTLFPRDLVRGLDIMKVLGSKSAEVLLSSDYNNDNLEDPFVGGTELKEKLDALQKNYSNFDFDFWTSNYYNNILAQIKTQATFENGSGFYFTESPMWNIKSLISAHSTWAELRHDTILYVKQVVAERAGDGDLDPTYRTKKIPLPTNYIEPNVPFWTYSLASLQVLKNTYEKYNLLDSESETCIDRLTEVYEKALRISQMEAADQEIDRNDNAWIRTIPNIFSNLVMVHQSTWGYIDNKDMLKMACIADVFTNAELEVCLETGVGTPLKLYVPLNDNGGKRIAIGYIPSYAEFYQPSSDRMTDEQWKNIVYNQNDEFINYMPDWEKSCILSTDK